MIISPSASSTSHEPSSHSSNQLLLTSLRSPIASLQDLEDILIQPLTGLGIVPPPFAPSRKITDDLGCNDILHILPTIQHVLLSTVLPTWLTPLRDAGLLPLIKQLFCPSQTRSERTDVPPRKSHDRCCVVTSALPTLLSHLHTLNSKDPGPTTILELSISLIADISVSYPVDLIHRSLFTPGLSARVRSDFTDVRETREWEDYVRSACSVPGKVANALEERTAINSREELEHGPYFTKMCLQTEILFFQTSQITPMDALFPSQSHLLLKLLNLGLFPPTPPSLPTQPSFFASTLPTIRRRLDLTSASITSSEAASAKYSESWAAVVRSLPSTSQQTFLASLFGALDCHVGVDTSTKARRKVGEGAKVLRGLLGKLDTLAGGENEEFWSTVTAIVCGTGRTWDLGIVRAVICWIAEPRAGSVDDGALEKLLDTTIAVWTDPEYIRHSLLSQHRYTSSLLLLTLASLPKSSSAPGRLALSPPFVSSISIYIGHPDRSVRRCGMLVAEVVATRCGKKLEFGGWEGESEGLNWARAMRGWEDDWNAEGFHGEADEAPASPTSEAKTADEPDSEVAQASPAPQPDSYDSDDSLTGYASPSSSRTPSPTPSELDEIEKDPSLRVGRKKPVARPVYLAQLAVMLRTDKNDDEGEAERLEVALASAEALVRRKKGFGLELDENAVELTIALVALNDNYELAGFEEKRQGALNALVACCPRRAAMTLVEQFFTNQYSTSQRFVILTALALGARELAGLPIPPSNVPRESIAFPSKMLPPALHRKYGTEREQGQVQQLLQGISRHAIEKSKDATEETLPPIVRERQLRVGRLGSSRVTEVRQTKHGLAATPEKADTTFADVAAEHFIVPLVNHMWQHLRDTQTRGRRGGAGTGMILGAVVLAQYLGTLAVLMHAARHTPAYLGVLAPEALEVAVALGSRPVEAEAERDEAEGGKEGEKEAAVLTAALEVALVVLDACVDLDGGRELGLQRTALLLAVGEWAGGLLAVLERGRKVKGGGGEAEGRTSSAAAGVVLKVDQVTEKWRRSMIGL